MGRGLESPETGSTCSLIHRLSQRSGTATVKTSAIVVRRRDTLCARGQRRGREFAARLARVIRNYGIYGLRPTGTKATRRSHVLRNSHGYSISALRFGFIETLVRDFN